MLCPTHIIECLRRNKIFPEAFSSSHAASHRIATNAIDYDTSDYFNSASSSENEWWIVDFKTNVVIENYSIAGGSDGGWIYNWDVDISDDNESWVYIHGRRNTTCSNQIFDFVKPYSCKYLRIIGRGPSADGVSPRMAFRNIKFYVSLKELVIFSQSPCNTFVSSNIIHRIHFVFFVHLLIYFS